MLDITVTSADWEVLDKAVTDLYHALAPFEGTQDGYSEVLFEVNSTRKNDDSKNVYSRTVTIRNVGKKALEVMTRFDIPHMVEIKIRTVT